MFLPLKMDENFDVEKIREAGRIAKEVREYARGLVKPGVKLLDVAEKIESKIVELGGKPAFPTNLSMNEIAAHSTPTYDDEETASGLLKLDFGVNIDGWCSDNAFSVDLEDSEENRGLIKAAEDALRSALDVVDEGVEVRQIGVVISGKISEAGFTPVANLSGHSIDQYDLHSGITVPNVDNGNDSVFGPGLYAVEPFATNGLGKVRQGKPSGIYFLQGDGNVRDSFAREVLSFIKEEYKGLPFCSRWIHKKFGSRGLLALRMIKQAGLISEEEQLVEAGNGKVAQAEHSVFLKDGKIITTL